jgi:hypothetical protein
MMRLPSRLLTRRAATVLNIKAVAVFMKLESAGAPGLEAYPLEANLTPSTSHTGYLSAFKRAGYKIVARHVRPRPIICFDLPKSDPLSPHSNTKKSK